jgi:hypothetical protein
VSINQYNWESQVSEDLRVKVWEIHHTKYVNLLNMVVAHANARNRLCESLAQTS